MNPKILEKVGLIFLAVVLFSFGFYLGFKYKPSDTKTASNQNQANSLQNQDKTNISPNQSQVIGKDVPEIFWIKTGSEPVCPTDYPIKGKFADGQKNYYLPENKSAARVKPDICFLNETYAKDKAGFVRKF